MSEYIVELNSNAVSGGKFLLGTVYLDAQEIVRCRDCVHFMSNNLCNLQDEFNEFHWLDV